MRPNTKENSENKQKCQYGDETIISQAVYQTEDRPSYVARLAGVDFQLSSVVSLLWIKRAKLGRN